MILRGKHCWNPIAVMGVVDTFGPYVWVVFHPQYLPAQKSHSSSLWRGSAIPEVWKTSFCLFKNHSTQANANDTETFLWFYLFCLALINLVCFSSESGTSLNLECICTLTLVYPYSVFLKLVNFRLPHLVKWFSSILMLWRYCQLFKSMIRGL